MDMEKLIKRLQKRGYLVSYFETKEEARDYIDGAIDGKTVGIGGSMTVKELGLPERLQTHNTVYWSNDPKQVEELGPKAVRDLAMHTDVYLTSVNALAKTGELINIDHTGNRIASTAYGHRKVFFVVGKNKIAGDVDKAWWRARNIAAPLNAKRLNRRTPCAKKADKCYDCASEERICRGFLLFERAVAGMESEIVLVNEKLGF